MATKEPHGTKTLLLQIENCYLEPQDFELLGEAIEEAIGDLWHRQPASRVMIVGES